MLVAFRAALRFLSFQKLLGLIDRFSSSSRPKGLDKEYQKKYVRAVTRAARYLLRDNVCLPQALAVYTMYKRHGEPARLQIGVRKESHGKLEAHAWVENRGEVVIGGVGIDLQRYVRLHGLDGVVI